MFTWFIIDLLISTNRKIFIFILFLYRKKNISHLYFIENQRLHLYNRYNIQ